MQKIQGQFVRVREMTEQDSEQIVAWRNHPSVTRWLIQWEPLTPEMHRRWFASAKSKGDLLLVYNAPDNTPLGMGSLYDFDRQRTSAEFGRLCFDPARPNAFAVLEATYLSHRIGFEVLRLQRLIAGCAVDNRAAVRLNDALGYQREGLRRRHLLTASGYADVVEFGMFAEEFRRQQLEELLYGQGRAPEVLWQGGATPADPRLQGVHG